MRVGRRDLMYATDRQIEPWQLVSCMVSFKVLLLTLALSILRAYVSGDRMELIGR